MGAIDPKAPIDHRRRRAQIIQECADWLASNGLSPSRAEYMANLVERNCERWATDIRRPGA